MSLHVHRRTLLLGGAAAAAATTVPLAAPAYAAGSLPATEPIDITVPSTEYFRGKVLHESHHAMQGLTFDDTNGRLFVVQATNGGDGSDLCVNQVSSSGSVVGSMTLANAGHGVSIAAQPVGSTTYLYVECDTSAQSDAGRGTALLRFPWRSGATPTGTKYLTGSSTITAASDPVNGRIMVRRKENGVMTLTVHDQAAFAAKDYASYLLKIDQPDVPGTFQGYAFLGSWLYTLDGTKQTTTDEDKINSYVSRYDLNTGRLDARSRTLAGKTLIEREPEGLAIHRLANGRTALVMGFASAPSAGSDTRWASVYYKA